MLKMKWGIEKCPKNRRNFFRPPLPPPPALPPTPRGLVSRTELQTPPCAECSYKPPAGRWSGLAFSDGPKPRGLFAFIGSRLAAIILFGVLVAMSGPEDQPEKRIKETTRTTADCLQWAILEGIGEHMRLTGAQHQETPGKSYRTAVSGQGEPPPPPGGLFSAILVGFFFHHQGGAGTPEGGFCHPF